MPTTIIETDSVASVRSGASIGADDAAGRDDHRVVAAGKRLRDRQHQRVALGEAVVDNVDGAVSAIADMLASRQTGEGARSSGRLPCDATAAGADQG